MSYSSKNGRRPNEYASKASHGYIIQDPEVSAFLKKCDLPKKSEDVDIHTALKIKINHADSNAIKHVVAVDGGYTEVYVKNEFPSATLTFFQFGGLVFHMEDLNEIAEKNFIDPEDIAKLNNIQRIKFALPTKNICRKDEDNFSVSFRVSLFEFFKNTNNTFIETLKWLIFHEFLDKPNEEYTLSRCPSCQKPEISIERKSLGKDFQIKCPHCTEMIYLTDVFRLHEAIDDELGAGGTSGYITTTMEQIVVADLIRAILETKPDIMSEILIIKDGPLAFFGQTANMHKPMRELCNFLFEKHNLFLVGLEKSGAFVEHAMEIADRLEPSCALLLSNEYIYKNIIPGKADSKRPYASTSYYGSKIIYKSSDERVYVATLPTNDSKVVLKPTKENFRNIDVILSNIEKLKCDMYDNSLFPVALANKLVSLADHPSSRILEKFAKENIRK